MNIFPQMDQYNDAVQHPKTAFLDPVLQNGIISTNALGIPLALGGGFALTYSITTNYVVNSQQKRFAVRCFHKRVENLQDSYSKIAHYLSSIGTTIFSGFSYQSSGIRVLGKVYPIVKMDWVDGETLGVYLEKHYNSPDSIKFLLEDFRRTGAFLQQKGVAHGDFQNGNVLVTRGGIKLVDYDGMYVPGMPAGQGREIGHKHFQHPERTGDHFGPYMDRFSLIVIDLSLRALIDRPDLFVKYSNGENIIFSANDYVDPTSSAVFSDLKRIPSLSRDVERLASLCEAPLRQVPSFEEFISGATQIRAFSTRSDANGLNPRITNSAYISAFEVVDATDYEKASKLLGDKVEVVGKILSVVRKDDKNNNPYVFINFGDWRRKIIKLNVWPRSLERMSDIPDLSWEGKWISVTGLLEPPFKGGKHSHIAITIETPNQYRFISEEEALRRLATSRMSADTTSGRVSRNQAILAAINGEPQKAAAPSTNSVNAARDHRSAKTPSSIRQNGGLTPNEILLKRIRGNSHLSEAHIDKNKLNNGSSSILIPPQKEIAASNTPPAGKLIVFGFLFTIFVLLLAIYGA